ncbi:MAG: hypothetical protein ACRD59_14270 [Candidatus Acidiferrales bacterium]
MEGTGDNSGISKPDPRTRATDGSEASTASPGAKAGPLWVFVEQLQAWLDHARRTGDLHVSVPIAEMERAIRILSGKQPDAENLASAPVWKVGDRVSFAHLLQQAFTVTRVHRDAAMIEIEGMTGLFGAHIFVAAPIDLPPVEIKAREVAPGKKSWQTPTLERLPVGTIQFYPEELDYVNAMLHSRGPEDKSFLGTFCDACLRADAENYILIRPALRQLMQKYPADPEHLRMERIDSGREPSSNRDDVQDAAAGER